MQKIIIVGAGKIAHVEEKIDALLLRHGYEDCEVVIAEYLNDKIQLTEELVLMKAKEVQQSLEIKAQFVTIAHVEEYDHENAQKQLSQQGWKKRPKHRR